MRFDLIDRVLEQDAQRLVALKCVTVAEEYLADHFPGFAVLPGVMMLETLVQAARRLLEEAGVEAAMVQPLVLAEVRNLRYGNLVRPGQSLEVAVALRKQDESGWEFQGSGSVQGQVALQGRFRLEALEALVPTMNP